MNTQDNNSGQDTYILAIIVSIVMIIFIYTASDLEFFFKLVLIWDVILALVGGVIGKDRNIGFGRAFFISLLLSPVIGYILAFNSPRKTTIVNKENTPNVAANTPTNTSIAEQLHKLNDLRKEGVLTDDEFAIQKDKLLNG